jgi:hypothetical protein
MARTPVAAEYVGIYWTLPVNWAGFRNLPSDVDEAAAASQTIRYQRERARAYVREVGGVLVSEIAFMDTRPDRATDAVRQVLRRAAPDYAGRHITLLAVRFADIHMWRHNPFLDDAAEELGLELLALSPDPVTVEDQVFDPALHFATWRKADESAMTRLRLEAHAGLKAALAEVPEGDGRWRTIARLLDSRGIRSIRGQRWTAENVRKLAGRLSSPMAED